MVFKIEKKTSQYLGLMFNITYWSTDWSAIDAQCPSRTDLLAKQNPKPKFTFNYESPGQEARFYNTQMKRLKVENK